MDRMDAMAFGFWAAAGGVAGLAFGSVAFLVVIEVCDWLGRARWWLGHRGRPTRESTLAKMEDALADLAVLAEEQERGE